MKYVVIVFLVIAGFGNLAGQEIVFDKSSRVLVIKSYQSTDQLNKHLPVWKSQTIAAVRLESCDLQTFPAALCGFDQVHKLELKNTSIHDKEHFLQIARMPAIEELVITTSGLQTPGSSLMALRFLRSIRIYNTSLDVMNPYERNYKMPEDLAAADSLTLGFGENQTLLYYRCYNAQLARPHLRLLLDILQGFRVPESNLSKGISADLSVLHPLVQEPFATARILPAVYDVDSRKSTTLEHPSGTVITIPANSFVRNDGTPVTGPVKITYREFRDPYDVICSGIPMHYDSGGVSGDFRSAGMFEIRGFENGTPVEVKPGAAIQVGLAVTDTSSDYNYYRLDEKQGWQYLQDPGPVDVGPASVTEWTAASREFANKLRVQNNNRKVYDTVSFDACFEDTNYVGLYRKPIIYNKKTQKRWNDQMYCRVVRGKSRKHEVLFKIQRTGHDMDENYELSLYTGVTWMITTPMSSREFRKKYGRRSAFNDLRIVNNNGTYTIRMKKWNSIEELHVVPVTIIGDSVRPYNPKVLSTRHRAYSSLLKSRRRNHDRPISRNLMLMEKYKKAAQLDSVRVWESVKNMMTGEEQAMDYRQFVTKVKGMLVQSTLQWIVNPYSPVFQQNLSVPKLGIYNCDQIRRLPDQVVVSNEFEDKQGRRVKADKVYVIDESNNQVFINYGDNKIVISSSARTSVVAMLHRGKEVYTFDANLVQVHQVTNREFFTGGTLLEQPASPQVFRQAVGVRTSTN